MILMVVDAYSKWIETKVVHSATTQVTIEQLRGLFATHGLPETIVSDNGTCFTSAEFKQFVTRNNIQHITSPAHNLWDKMTNVKQMTRMSAGKYIKLNTGTEVLTLKATTSLFAPLLVIARSSRENVDPEEVIGMHEFSYMSKVITAPDGSMHPSTDNSIVTKALEYLVVNDILYFCAVYRALRRMCLVVD